ncbi:hypothetical protein AB1N83_011249 [Pleurotus pulmonarius]
MESRVSLNSDLSGFSDVGRAVVQRGLGRKVRHASRANVFDSCAGHSASEVSDHCSVEQYSKPTPTAFPEPRRRCAKGHQSRRIAAMKINYRCPICLDTPKVASATRCGHVFCAPCIKRALLEHETCPSCRKAAVICQLRKIYLTGH